MMAKASFTRFSFSHCRSRAGVPADSHSLPGPDDTLRRTLSNGITVLARSNFNSPSVVISGYLPAGSLFDPDGRLGLADFTASALMRGTARRNFQEIYDALESVGASLGIHGGTHSAGFGGRALAEDLDMLLSLLGEILRQPAFPQDHIERLRAQFLTGLAIRAQDTGEMASLAFDQIVYKNHPYSRPEDGYPETLQAIRREDMLEFHRAHYGPRGFVITVVGAVDPQEAVNKVGQILGDWDNPSQPDNSALPPAPALTATVQEKVTIPGKSQSDIIMGAIGPQRSAPDYLAASLGNSVFGQFGMYGRIGDVVREQAGLAYYAYSSLSGGLGPGPWYVSAGVDPANVERTVDLIHRELERFVREPVSKEELDDSKENYIGRLPLSLESNAGVAGALINLERYGLGLDYYRRYPAMISAISVQDVFEAARHYLNPERLGIAVAGP